VFAAGPNRFTLAETIKLAVDAKNAVAMWGPYEIRKVLI
jgi:hypothetical protein